MPELDRFETRLTAAVGSFADRAETTVDATAMATRTIGRRRPGTLAWLGRPLPAPAWAVLLLGLLLAAGLGATLLAGAWRGDRSSVVPPSSTGPAATATPLPTAVPFVGTDVLATTRAHALPAAATCPPGSRPDAPGPADGLRPTWGRFTMAFDRQSGKAVTHVQFADQPAQTWAFDVCTNSWAQLRPAPNPDGRETLVYDADSDRTVALSLAVPEGARAGRLETWSYDLESDAWTRGAWSPVLTSAEFVAAYHDPSGLVVVYDGNVAWAYDVESDAWSAVRWDADALRPAGMSPEYMTYEPPVDRFVVGLARARQLTLVIDPVSGRTGEPAPGLGYCTNWWGPWRCGTAVFDAVSGRTIWNTNGHVEAFDAATQTWETLYLLFGPEAAGSPSSCGGFVADPVNGRLVCSDESGDVAAFTPSTRTWQWLLAPQGASGSPSPSPSAESASPVAEAGILATTAAHELLSAASRRPRPMGGARRSRVETDAVRRGRPPMTPSTTGSSAARTAA